MTTPKIVKNEKNYEKISTMKRNLNELGDIVINAFFVIVDIYRRYRQR